MPSASQRLRLTNSQVRYEARTYVTTRTGMAYQMSHLPGSTPAPNSKVDVEYVLPDDSFLPEHLRLVPNWTEVSGLVTGISISESFQSLEPQVSLTGVGYDSTLFGRELGILVKARFYPHYVNDLPPGALIVPGGSLNPSDELAWSDWRDIYFGWIIASEMKVDYQTNQWTVTCRSELYRLELMSPGSHVLGPQNIALGKPVKASSWLETPLIESTSKEFFGLPELKPENIVDGRRDTLWMSRNQVQGHEIPYCVNQSSQEWTATDRVESHACNYITRGPRSFTFLYEGNTVPYNTYFTLNQVCPRGPSFLDPILSQWFSLWTIPDYDFMGSWLDFEIMFGKARQSFIPRDFAGLPTTIPSGTFIYFCYDRATLESWVKLPPGAVVVEWGPRFPWLFLDWTGDSIRVFGKFPPPDYINGGVDWDILQAGHFPARDYGKPGVGSPMAAQYWDKSNKKTRQLCVWGDPRNINHWVPWPHVDEDAVENSQVWLTYNILEGNYFPEQGNNQVTFQVGQMTSPCPIPMLGHDRFSRPIWRGTYGAEGDIGTPRAPLPVLPPGWTYYTNQDDTPAGRVMPYHGTAPTGPSQFLASETPLLHHIMDAQHEWVAVDLGKEIDLRTVTEIPSSGTGTVVTYVGEGADRLGASGYAVINGEVITYDQLDMSAKTFRVTGRGIDATTVQTHPIDSPIVGWDPVRHAGFDMPYINRIVLVNNRVETSGCATAMDIYISQRPQPVFPPGQDYPSSSAYWMGSWHAISTGAIPPDDNGIIELRFPETPARWVLIHFTDWLPKNHIPRRARLRELEVYRSPRTRETIDHDGTSTIVQAVGHLLGTHYTWADGVTGWPAIDWVVFPPSGGNGLPNWRPYLSTLTIGDDTFRSIFEDLAQRSGYRFWFDRWNRFHFEHHPILRAPMDLPEVEIEWDKTSVWELRPSQPSPHPISQVILEASVSDSTHRQQQQIRVVYPERPHPIGVPYPARQYIVGDMTDAKRIARFLYHQLNFGWGAVINTGPAEWAQPGQRHVITWPFDSSNTSNFTQKNFYLLDVQYDLIFGPNSTWVSSLTFEQYTVLDAEFGTI